MTSSARSTWTAARRARLKDLAGRAAKNLARRAEAKQSLPDALYWWRRAFDFCPFDEATLCRIMSLLTASGYPSTALDEFERFRRRAHHELGATPSPLTLQLVVRIRAGALDATRRWLEDRRQPQRNTRWPGSRRATDRARH